MANLVNSIGLNLGQTETITKFTIHKGSTTIVVNGSELSEYLSQGWAIVSEDNVPAKPEPIWHSELPPGTEPNIVAKPIIEHKTLTNYLPYIFVIIILIILLK